MWVFFTCWAVTLQTVRNALQSRLTGQVNSIGVTLSRFILAAPIAGVYLTGLYTYSNQPVPSFSVSFLGIVLLAGIFQIAATFLMVVLLRQKNFAIGAGLAKSEAIVAGILGTLFFGSHLNTIGWLGIVVGAIAVIIMSMGENKRLPSVKTMLIGLACGTCFALTSLLVREASKLLDIPTFHAAGWVLLIILLIQSIGLSVYIALTQPNTFLQMIANKGQVLAISTVSCLGSIGWFTAMAMQHVAYVKTLGQIEVLLTLLLAHYWLKDNINRQDVIGLLLIALGAILVMWA